MRKNIEKKYVIVTGGQLENKGAQAMTFITVSEMKKRYPGCEIVLFSDLDYKRPKEELDIYAFTVEKFPSLSQIIKAKLSMGDDYCKRIATYFGNAICAIDISGYRLGSNWGNAKAIKFCEMPAYAKHFRIPYYAFPQSFGPFHFRGKKGAIVNWMIHRYLRYAKVIMAREDEGKQLLEKNYRLKNVVKTSDMVIQSPEADVGLVYRVPQQIREISVLDHSVALIPNSKNNKYGSSEEMTELYTKMIDSLLDKGRKIYLLYHSMEDREICAAIKEKYQDSDHVIWVEEELSCFEYSNVVSKFDYVIASRYHSIVHAYKKGIPALIIGWAIKYRELAKDFGQDDYCFSVKELNDDEILKKLAGMEQSYPAEKEKILANLAVLLKHDVFDYISQ